jgi:hypothetical protein
VEQALGQSGFDRYTKLLAKLFRELVGLDITGLARDGASQPLLAECTVQQELRNRIIHRGETATPLEAENARLIAVAVYDLVVVPMIGSLGLRVVGRGEIKP